MNNQSKPKDFSLKCKTNLLARTPFFFDICSGFKSLVHPLNIFTSNKSQYFYYKILFKFFSDLLFQSRIKIIYAYCNLPYQTAQNFLI